MSQIIAVLGIIGVVAAGAWFQYRLSGRRAYRPLWIAFSTTGTAVLFLVAGIIGYTLSTHDRFVAGTPWAGAIIWWQVFAGIALLLPAAYFWRKGLRTSSSTGR